MEKMKMGGEPIPKQDNVTRVRFLEGKQELSPAEQAELTARRETGDSRIAFLESKKAGGEELSPAEQAELTARREKLEKGKK